MDMYMKIAWQKGACSASNVCLLSPFLQLRKNYQSLQNTLGHPFVRSGSRVNMWRISNAYILLECC